MGTSWPDENGPGGRNLPAGRISLGSAQLVRDSPCHELTARRLACNRVEAPLVPPEVWYTEMINEPPQDIVARLDRIEVHLAEMRDLLASQRTLKDWYTTKEFAALLGKAEFTVREWCRLGRVRAEKRQSGRGKHCAWVIAHDELLRYQREGLLPARQ